MIAIYSLKLGGKTYIGSSSNVEKRCREHFRLLKNNEHHSKKLQEAYNNLKELPIFEIVQELDTTENIFKIEEAYNITVIKHSNKDVMKMGLYINTEDLYNYTHLVKVADKFILDCTYRRLFQRMYITKGEDNLPTEDSHAICYTPFGHTVMIDGLEAMILIKIKYCSNI
jgi:hypothetical protein